MRETKFSKLITKEFLQKEYWDNGKSLYTISKETNANPQTILNYMKKFNIERRTKRENFKGELNPNYKDGRFNKQHFCKECNNKISYITWLKSKLCRVCSKKGKRNPSWKNIKKPKCKICGKELSRNENLYCNKHKGTYILKKRNKCYKGRNNPMFGKTTQTKRIYYKNICMRSSWEVKYAKYLDENNIKWEYEPKRFYCGNISYLPDFYLPEKDLYIEIKGFFNSNGLKRFKEFKKYYPNIKIAVLMKKELIKLKVI